MKTKKIKKKLSLNKTTIVALDHSQLKNVGGFTGNCLSFINVTCPDPDCDVQSMPINECIGGGGDNVGEDDSPNNEYTWGNETACYTGEGTAPY